MTGAMREAEASAPSARMTMAGPAAGAGAGAGAGLIAGMARVAAGRHAGCLVEREAQPGGESDRPERAEMVLGQPRVRVAHGADKLGIQVSDAANVVDDPPPCPPG